MEGFPDVFPDRLTVAQTYWVEDAHSVLASFDGPRMMTARRLYVVDLLALLALREESTGTQLDKGGRAELLNALYADGLSRAAASCGGSVSVRKLDYEAWARYMRGQVYPAIDIQRGVANPQTYYELMQGLHEGSVSFSD